MMRSLYSSVAGLKAHQTAMDVVGNNISNVNTYGYKTQRTTFRDAYYQTLQGSSDSTKDIGGVNAVQIGYGSNVATVDTNHEIGGYAATGYTMDCYIDGEGYFVATDANGNALLTRVGAFCFDADGFLVDGNGRYICGYSPKIQNGNVVTNPDGTAVMDVDKFNTNVDDAAFQGNRICKPLDAQGEPIALSSISIGATGVVTGVNNAGEIITIGQIVLANVPNPDGLTLLGDSYWKAMNNVGAYTFETPGHLTGELVTGGLEASNVDLANEVTEMIRIQRGYQANSRVINVADTMLEELINLKR
ncbi:MAG: flagellar hook-basal body complex protein [Oscillospiraceae bacterium]|nr:flagellar hook-basal body complex protein [Oscillospiraceae bacterium]